MREALEHLPLDDNSTIGGNSTMFYNYSPGGYFTGSNYPPPETIEVAKETDWEDKDGHDTPTPGSKRKEEIETIKHSTKGSITELSC